jgi:hypothetical protein
MKMRTTQIKYRIERRLNFLFSVAFKFSNSTITFLVTIVIKTFHPVRVDKPYRVIVCISIGAPSPVVVS